MDPSREANREVAAGYFRDTKKAERAVTALRQAGFAQIGIASRKSDDAEKMADRTDAKAGLAVSSASGGVLEETGGESDYADPQDVQATLVAAHIPEDQARGFQEKLQHGGALVTVETVAPRGTEARRLLESEGAEDSGSSTTGYAATPAPATTPVHEPPRAAAPETAAGAHVFNLHGELLRIHKERVQRGEVRLRKETVTEHQNINVPVTHEQVVIERSPAAEGTPASSSADEAREVRIPLTQEKVSVEKQPVVTEQVRVAKKEVQDTQPVREELRHDELEVESEGNLTPEEREALRRGEKPRRAA
jgi:uncharacterized protein (TIGR02271 family)